jgi:UDP:flavonoid glycosyltransferase YjiC (YdhE family)
LLVTSSVAIAARLAAEKRGIPWIGAVFQPIAFLSAFDSPTLFTGGGLSGALRRFGPAASRLTLAALKSLSGILAKPVHDFRREIGLPGTLRNPVLAGQFSTRGSLALYSPVFGNVQPDFPPRTVVTGFPFYDHEHGATDPPDAALAQFLAVGPSPIVFTLGSTFVRTPGTFYRDSLLAARKLGRRAVLLVGETSRDHFEDALFDEAFVCGYAPYSQLFPYARAIVHQGGIGTLGQGLRAGRPQLIVPFFGDQPDNAARAVRLGVARTLSRRHYNASRASQELGVLLESERYISRARAVSGCIAHEDGAGEAARAIRNFAEQVRELE